MAEWLNGIGVTIILFAFVMLSLKRISSDSAIYKWSNFVGGALLCWGAYLIPSYSFVVMEGVWSAVAFYSIIKKN
jgi:hypothetical protein